MEYKKHESLVCDPEALEKQALGCLSKALATRHGEQDYVESSEHLGTIWLWEHSGELHAKINKVAVLSRHKTGVEFGVSSGLVAGYDIELEPSYALDQSVINRNAAYGVSTHAVGTARTAPATASATAGHAANADANAATGTGTPV